MQPHLHSRPPWLVIRVALLILVQELTRGGREEVYANDIFIKGNLCLALRQKGRAEDFSSIC